MIDCSNAEIRDQLPDLLHGRLDERTRHMVDAHLIGCEACRAELELLRSIRAAAPTPRINVARIARAISTPVRSRRGLRDIWRLAAVITIMVVGGSSLLVFRRAAISRSDSMAALASARVEGVELLDSEAYSQLNEGQLKVLLHDIQQLDALPLIEPDAAASVSLWPASGGVE